MLNAMTIDLEDWAQGVLDPACPVSDRVVANTERVLEFLDRHNVRATFFALGSTCKAHPGLLPMIAAAGHEIASHGYDHELVHRLRPEQFESDLKQSIDVIESQTGRRPLGYRAPAFSITKETQWAGPILARLGFRYSSSIFPIPGRRYGIPDVPRGPHRWPNCDLIELPMSTLRFVGRNWPVCGGGYTRLLPAAIMAHAIGRLNRAGLAGIIYLHPYEMAAGEVATFARTGLSISKRRWFTQELWRSRVPSRLSRLLRQFQFGTVGAVLAEYPLSAGVSDESWGMQGQTCFGLAE